MLYGARVVQPVDQVPVVTIVVPLPPAFMRSKPTVPVARL